MSAEPHMDVQQAPRDPAGTDGLSLRHAVLLWAAFAAISLAVVQPALRGAFINDDYSLIVNHPYLNPLNQENLIAILNPFGGAATHGVNYAPVILLLHALEKALFGGEYREAIDCFERAFRLGGPLRSKILVDLEFTRGQWREARKAAAP